MWLEINSQECSNHRNTSETLKCMAIFYILHGFLLRCYCLVYQRARDEIKFAYLCSAAVINWQTGCVGYGQIMSIIFWETTALLSFQHIETVLILAGLHPQWRLINRVFKRFSFVAECLPETRVVSFLKAGWQLKMIGHPPAVKNPLFQKSHINLTHCQHDTVIWGQTVLCLY